ncbi:hypothetical protein BJ912DRAFT_1079956 [Pholiota molesta]|nr:hypothetical protein BJ912DRAFT_1079956 [Pholiota molesta]
MADLKPLPALPSSLLSVEAQNHRACLIKHFLSEIHEHGIDSRRGGWLYVFEEVLDNLSQQFIRGDWLASIRDQGSTQSTTAPATTEDSGFDVVPANIGCEFSPGTFALQEQGQDEMDGTVLYGLSDGLEVDENLRLVGGTFTFKGVTSPVQHHLLRKALRLAVYFVNSGVRLNFARPKLPAPSPSTPLRSTDDATQPKESISEPTNGATPRRSIEGAVSGLRLRRLSFLGDRAFPSKINSQPIQVKKNKRHIIPSAHPELAEKEKRNDAQGGPLKRRLKGDERVALTSILGWDGKDAEGRGMSVQDDSALERTGSTIALNTSSQMSASSTANLLNGSDALWETPLDYIPVLFTHNGNDFALASGSMTCSAPDDAMRNAWMQILARLFEASEREEKGKEKETEDNCDGFGR